MGLIAIILFGGFQNCTRTNFDVVSEMQSMSVESSAEIDLKIETSKFTTKKDVKVLLVVDTSASMRNSINNLSRNVDAVLSKIKNLNASVRIMTTDDAWTRPREDQNLVYGSINPSVVTRKDSRQIKISNQMIFKYRQDSGNEDQVSIDIKNAILGLGQQGKSIEMPLLTVATAVQLDEYFEKDAPTLIYMISDEDDSSIKEEYQSPYIATMQQPSDVTVSKFFKFSFLNSGEGGAAYNQESRYESIKACKTARQQRVDWGFNFVSACTEVNNQYKFRYAKTCAEFEKLNSQGLLPENEAAAAVNMVKCNDVANAYVRIDGSVSAKSILGSNVLNASDKPKVFLSAMKSMLDAKLGSKYLLAASVNMQGQRCSLSFGQSYGNVILEFQKLYSAEQFLVSSICAEQDITEQLEKIATEFETLINKTYQISLPAGAKVTAIRIVSKDGKQRPLDSNLYSIHNGVIEFLDTKIFAEDDVSLKLIVTTTTIEEVKEVK